jgi:hypothetical protein
MSNVTILRPERCNAEQFDAWAEGAARVRLSMPPQLMGVEIEQMDDGVRVCAVDKVTGQHHSRHFDFEDLRT